MESKSAGFTQRLKLASIHEQAVASKLMKLGFTISLFGQEVIISEVLHRAIRFNYDDKTVVFIRALPDWVASKPTYPAFLVEAKTVRDSTTPYFSYEYTFYLQHLIWAHQGVKTLSIFTDFKADWVENLRPTQIRWDTSQVKGGSGTPFILIPKISVPSLDDVIDKFLRRKL